MANAHQEEIMRYLANNLDEILEDMYGERMSFILLVAPFSEDNESKVADYVGNSSRETAIEFMKETIQRFEEKDVIPASKGQC